MRVTEDHAKVVSIFTDILIKLALAASSIVAFWVILNKLLNSKDGQLNWVLAFLDTALSGTIYYIIAHYFPAFKNAARSTRPKTK